QGIAFVGLGDELVATANRGSDIGVWSATDGRMVAKLPRSNRDDAFYAGGALVSAPTSASSVSLWRLDRRASRWTMDLGEEINGLQYSQDGGIVAALGSSKVALWDVNEQRQFSSFTLADALSENDRFERVVVSRNGATVAASTAMGKLIVRWLRE